MEAATAAAAAAAGGGIASTMVGRDEASLRKLSLLEARMMGLNQGSRGADSEEGSGSRLVQGGGGDSNSCSSVIGFSGRRIASHAAGGSKSALSPPAQDGVYAKEGSGGESSEGSRDAPPYEGAALKKRRRSTAYSPPTPLAATSVAVTATTPVAEFKGVGGSPANSRSPPATDGLVHHQPSNSHGGRIDAAGGGTGASSRRSKATGSAVGTKDIQSYFKPNLHTSTTAAAAPAAVTLTGSPTQTVPGESSRHLAGAIGAGANRNLNKNSDDEVIILEERENGTAAKQHQLELARVKEELEKERRNRQQLQDMVEALRGELAKVHDSASRIEEDSAARALKMKSALRDLLVDAAARDSKAVRDQVARDSVELGKIVMGRSPGMAAPIEVWENGAAAKSMRATAAGLLEKRAALEARRKAASKALRASEPGTAGELEALQDEESARMRLAELKREEVQLADDRKSLDSRRVRHHRELLRVKSEDRSSFAKVDVLHNRYVLQRLLGKGGFSEVWLAYDLEELRTVAVKIHQLDSSWSDQKKTSYIKHASREYKIHQAMSHPRVVGLYDVFEIDNSTFATVLEHCEGTDLEQHLRSSGTLPERDARSILLQVMCGLLYLNTPQEGFHGGIIHYDLKPANILFDAAGDVKITDFGLSKIMDAGSDGGIGTSMELTSQGAGTYWYLPPECFLIGGKAPRISSKVDVWSMGVIFYQMLFGVRPFGEGLSQDSIMAERTMLRAKAVTFPAKPCVSEEAKDFIKTCLTHSQVDRPDVAGICRHSYIRPSRPGHSR